ncbi:MAG: DUF748 domain-containing protein [Methylococcaceae bacterium]|nr:DUF748 domain-containing protein [Methylococcaceae bacterium]
MQNEFIKKVRKPVLILAGLISLYALLGFLILPRYIQTKLPELIASETGRKATIERIEFNPFSLEMNLLNFSMQEKDTQDFLKFSEFYINVQVWESVKKSALVIADVKLSEPYVRVEMFTDNRYNFSDLLSDAPEKKPEEESKEIFPVIVQQLDISQGEVLMVDSVHADSMTDVIKPLNLHLDGFSTLLGEGSVLKFSATLNSGGDFQWQGNVGVNPLFSNGSVDIKGVQFPRIWQLFLQEKVNFKWLDGTQLVKFNYALAYADDVFLFKLTDGQLVTENLKFSTKNSNKTLIDIPYLSIEDVDFDLNKQAINIAKIESKKADLDLIFNQTGELNYQTLFAGQVEPQSGTKKAVQDSSPWTIKVADVALHSAHINFTDKRPKEAVLMEVSRLDMGLKDYHLITDSHLLMTANQGYVNLQDFNLHTLQDPALVHVPSVKIAGIDFNLKDRSFKIQSINSQDALIKAWLTKDGVLNYQDLFATTQIAENKVDHGSGDKSVSDKPWLLALKSFEINNYALQFKDYTQEKPVDLSLSELDFSVADFNTQQGTQLPVSFNALFNETGKLKLTGSSILEPFSSDLNVDINHIEIGKFEPYINQSAKLDILKGHVNTLGKLLVSQSEKGDLALNYQGNVVVKDLHTRDQILHQDFLKWQNLALNGLDFDLQPVKLKIKSIDLDSPYARVTIKKDKTVNIDDIIIAQSTDEPVKQKETKEQANVPFDIGTVTIREGSSDFSDYSLILPFVVKLNALDGQIDTISSNQKTKMHVDINGKVFDLSSVDIKGDFNPSLDEMDLGMHFESLPLPFISPYMVEFAGYKVEKGKMSIDFLYKIRDRQLISENNLLIDQFEWGEKVENPKAIDLPLGLAVALLKDRNGRITLNLPVSGSLDNPDFSVGPIIYDVFINLLTKVIASPFTTIGSFLGSHEDFSTISFQAGNADLSVQQLAKLDALLSALTSKPELSLEIKAAAYITQDWPAMQDQALMDQLKQIRADELKKQGEVELAEYIKLSEEEYTRLLADLFIQSYPELVERSVFGTPKLLHPDMGEFDVVAKNMMRSMIKPDEHKLFILAATRARNIARHLTREGGVAQSRIFILDGAVLPEVKKGELKAQLTLKVQ